MAELQEKIETYETALKDQELRLTEQEIKVTEQEIQLKEQDRPEEKKETLHCPQKSRTVN